MERSTNTSSTAWNRVLENLDLDSLSHRSRSISLLIGEDLVEGYKLSEISVRLGQPQSWVSERLDELRSEIALDAGGFLPLSFTEYEALSESIKEFGVRTPILIGEHQLIDGRHRFLLSRELGLNEIPAEFIFGLSAEEEHDLGIAVNSARRQLNRRQKRLVVRSELKRDWSRPSRQIAVVCGVSGPTVEDVRDEMRREAAAAESGDVTAPVPDFVPPPKEKEKRVDSKGRVQPAYVPERHPPELSQVEKFLGYATCSHGQMHGVYRLNEQLFLKEDRD